MKSLFLAVVFSSLFAVKGDAQNVPGAISQAFYSAFPFAAKANWSAAGKLFKAEFVQDNEKQFAFFNNSGELVALSKYIRFQDLPARLRLELIKQFPDHNISEIFEIRSDLETDYFTTLERNGIVFTLRSVQNKWSLFPETK